MNMRMPDREYNETMHKIKDWRGTKEQLQALYDRIYENYEDAREVLYRLDKYQSKWTMNLYQ